MRSATPSSRQGQAGVRAEGRRVPEVLVDGHEHRRAEVLPRAPGLARAGDERQADDRPRRRHDRPLGPRRRLLRGRGRGARVRGRAQGDFVNQLAAFFNSPVWFNVGFEEKPQCSACFILSIDDSMESILDWIRREGVIFRGGSGSGVNLSTLRSSKEQLEGRLRQRPG